MGLVAAKSLGAPWFLTIKILVDRLIDGAAYVVSCVTNILNVELAMDSEFILKNFLGTLKRRDRVSRIQIL